MMGLKSFNLLDLGGEIVWGRKIILEDFNLMVQKTYLKMIIIFFLLLYEDLFDYFSIENWNYYINN